MNTAETSSRRSVTRNDAAPLAGVSSAVVSYVINRGPKRLVEEIEPTGDALDMAGDGLTMIAYSAEPGSQAEDQLKLLATSSATARTTASEPAGVSSPGDQPS